jgi:very-short-patch-repair endonuclease
MRGSIQQSAAWALAARQHGVVSRAQLLAIGFSAKTIQRRLADARLHILWRGVYAVGRPDISRHGRLLAATLACGPDAFISHWSAAELWEIMASRPGPIHVSVIAAYDRRLSGITVHRRVALSAGDVTESHRVPATTATRTLIDIATSSPRSQLEAAVNEADKRDLVDPEALREAVDAAAGQPGVGALRKLLDRRTFALTDSELERRFLPLARDAGLPRPETQVHVEGFRVDFYWRDLSLVVETDGLRYHRTPSQQAKDRVRDQALTAAGLTALRFTHAQVRFEPSHVRSILESVKARLLN